MLQRMSVDGDDSDGSGPLMVLFVEVLVEARVVEQPERKDDEGQKIKSFELNANIRNLFKDSVFFLVSLD